MSKRKWYTRAIYSMVALAFVAGLALVPAAPATAQVAPTEVCGWFDVWGDTGTAEWAAGQTYTGDYTPKLNGAAGEYVFAYFVPDPGITAADLDDITADPEWSYWYNLTGTGGHGVELELLFTMPGYDPTTGDGRVEITVFSGSGYFTDDGEWHKQAVLADSGACVYYGWDPTDGTAFDSEDSAPGFALEDVLTNINLETVMTDGPDLATDWELTRVGLQLVVAGTAYTDEVTIDGTTYDLEPCYTIEPEIAYNVKTADETFTIYDGGTGEPVDPDLVDFWTVAKGEGTGDVIIVAGGDTAIPDAAPHNYITVRMITMGDCIITADVAGIPVAVNAEKKWGEIYRTILTPDPLTGIVPGYTVVVDEFVEATFLPTPVAVHGAGGAKVTWWLIKAGVADANLIALKAYLDDFANFDISSDTSGYGCGRYGGWSPDPANPIAAPETFMATLYPVQAATDTDFTKLEGVAFGPDTKAVSYTDHALPVPAREGYTDVDITFDDPGTGRIEDVILVVLADYPLDKNGQNPVCVEYYTWLPPPPPPPLEKLIDIAWKGEKEVVEANFGEAYDGYLVKFVREHGGPGAFVSYGSESDFVYTVVGYDGVARAIYLSDVQGQVDIDAELYAFMPEEGLAVEIGGIVVVPAADVPEYVSPFDERGIILLYLELDEIELVNIEKAGLTSDKAWTLPGAISSSLLIDESAYLRARVTGWFEDENGDRWVLPDDYAEVASRIHHDVMDSPIDNIVGVNELETATNKLGEFGPYYDITKHLADPTKPCELVAWDPVIGPFSKCEPYVELGWDVDNQPAVPADSEVDGELRTTVVPDGKLDEFDATMPPAEIIFVVNSGKGILLDVDKGNIYVKKCTSTEHGTLNLYPNPYYKQEIPAHWLIAPMYGAGSPGYDWDSWGWEGIPEIDGPYDFYDDLEVWNADYLTINLNFDLGVARADNPALKVYSDNRGEAWVNFTQKSFGISTIVAVADYPYLVGKNPPIISNEVIKIGADQKEVKVYVDDVLKADLTVDPIRKMLYVFVRDYDGDAAKWETVEWLIDGPYGILEALLTGTAGPVSNPCEDCEGSIAGDGRSGAGCTRVMTAAEIAKFVAVAELEFADEDDADDYAIAGVKVLSSHLEDVNVSIKIHDCWDGDVIIMTEDKMVEFTEDNPAIEVGLESIMDHVLLVYHFDNTTKVWSFYNPAHPEISDLDTLNKFESYWVNVDAACTLDYEGVTYPAFTTGWNQFGWVGA